MSEILNERFYSVLLAPHFTEKVSLVGDEINQYAFKVANNATKAEIKAAVEALFKVEVHAVTTLNVKGKKKRTSGGGISRKKNWKKAYVRLAAGHDLDFATAE